MGYIDKVIISSKEYDVKGSSIDLSEMIELKDEISGLRTEIEKLREQSEAVDLSDYYKKTEIDELIKNIGLKDADTLNIKCGE